MLPKHGARLHARLQGPQLHRWQRYYLGADSGPRAQPSGPAPGATSAAAAAAAAARQERQQAGVKPGDTLELTCTDLAFGGEGICRLEGEQGRGGLVVFVEKALPGERLRARVVQNKRSFARALKLATLRPHDNAAEPVCEHFGPCGGCSLQNLAYEAQLASKQRQVADLLARTAGMPEADVAAVLQPIVGCAPGEQLGFRNKMEFSFSAGVWRPQAAGQEEMEPTAGGRRGGSREGSRSGSRGAKGAPSDGGESSSTQPARKNGSGGGNSSSSGAFALGLHRPGSTTQVLPIRHCHLQPDPANLLLRYILELCRQYGLQPFDPVNRRGLLQDVVIRRGSSSRGSSAAPNSENNRGSSAAGAEVAAAAGVAGAAAGSMHSREEEYLVNFVTARDGRQALAEVARALLRGPEAAGPTASPSGQEGQPSAGAAPALAAAPEPWPAVVGVVNSVSQRGRPTGERRLEAEHVLAGRGTLTERLCGLEFEVSANSFFQTNTRQAEVLYQLVAQAAGLRAGDTLLDLYCGTGSIGLTLAARCASLVGVEINPAAVRDAQRNAARNDIANATFLQGDLHKLQLEGRLARPDVVVVDPARPGLSPLVVEYLRSCGARRIVYVSCNAATQARDIRVLCSGSGSGSVDGGGASGGGGTEPYRLISLQAVDLYPQTHHVETLAVLDRCR